jgi:thiaminase (transcriptional activator TenA)
MTSAPTFTESIRAPNEDVWKHLLDNRFVAAMADSTLPLECFRFYIEQNLIYLPTYAKVLGFGAARSNTLAELERFSGSLRQIVDVEIGTNQQLRDQIIAAGAADRHGSNEPSPACLAYTSYLLATAATGDALDIVAATLPCAWSYHEIALQYPNPAPHPVYRDWLGFFASDDYHTYLTELLAKLDSIAAKARTNDLDRLQRHFRTGARLERGFWEMGYTMQQWPDSTGSEGR